MKAFRRLLPTAMLIVLAGCSLEDPYEPDPGETFENLYVPSDYATLTVAIAAAATWDTIRVAPGDYEESFTLPIDVSLIGAAAERTFIIGQVTINDSSIDARFEGVHVSNPDGSGLLLIDASPQISHCRFEDCDDAGVEIVGNSATEIEGCQITGNARGVVIRDSDQAGHYWDFDHLYGSAPKITSSNLFNNGGLDTLAINIVFENISAPDTIGVSGNYWGLPAGPRAADLTIFDNKDGAPYWNGYADTEKDGVGFLTSEHTLAWQWDD